MSSKQRNSHSLPDAQSNYSDEQKSIQETTNRSAFSNFHYVVPAYRSRMEPKDTASKSTASVILVWRRNVQITPPKSQTPTALVQRASAPSAPFRPMDTVRGASPHFTAEEKIRAGFSWRYRGDINNPKNSSAGIGPEQNCALFLTNLPAGTTEKILLDALGIHAPFGRVHATSIVPVTDTRHSTAGAKLAMFGREEAVRVSKFVNAGELRIAGRIVNIAWNNNRSPIQSDMADTASRVLEIHGPCEVVDIHRLSRYFEDNLKYQTQDITVLNEDKEERLIRWTFCSFRAQAQVARKALRAEWPGLHIRWGIDPMTVSINMVPTAMSTMLPLFPQQRAPVAASEASHTSAGDLIRFDSDVDEEADSEEDRSDFYDF